MEHGKNTPSLYQIKLKNAKKMKTLTTKTAAIAFQASLPNLKLTQRLSTNYKNFAQKV